MAPRLVLHIGDCKTGSTVIQTMLGAGEAEIEGLRLRFPGKVGQAALARSLANKPENYPARWEGAARRMMNAEFDIGVLSSEIFEFVAPHKVKAALETHFPDLVETMQVVVYVRPHASRALSQFGENLKLGHELDGIDEFLARFVRNRRLHFAERLEKWRDVFGDRLIVRVFARDRLSGGDVRRDFLETIAPGRAVTIREGVQVDNAQLTLPDLALMRHLQRRFRLREIGEDARVAFGKQFGRLLSAEPPKVAAPTYRMPNRILDSLRQDLTEDAARMDAEWVGEPCFAPALAEAQGTDDPQSLEVEDHHAPETIRQAEAWADLVVRFMTDPQTDFVRLIRQAG